jgi:DNA mismatch repair protein MutS
MSSKKKTKIPKKTIIDEYLFYHNKYNKIYGKKTLIFMMVGGFYELYGTDDEGPDMNKISEITNMVKTKKDKTVVDVTRKNPYMMGFNIAALDKFMKMMIDNGFTIVMVDQVTPPPKPKRAITGIYSPGTYISGDTNIDATNIVSIYLEDEKQLNGNYLTCIGLSSVDLSTGKCSVYEVVSNNNDEKYALDEAYRFILAHSPKELIVTRNDKTSHIMTKESIMSYLEIEDKHIHYNNKLNKTFTKISYQNEFLGKIYKNTGILSPIEHIDMEKLSYARLSFIILLDFAYKHNENLINDLDKPEVFENEKHLILGNNAIYQLNVLETGIDTGGSRFKSLFDIINNTSTAMGRRFLKSSIIQPLNDCKEIQLRYDSIEELLNDDLFSELEKLLSSILDIERLGRKLFLTYIQPYELANLIESFSGIDNIYKFINKTKYVKKYAPSKDIVKSLTSFLNECKNLFNTDELKKQSLNDITGSFFKKGNYPKIDELQSQVVDNIKLMEDIRDTLSSYIKENTSSKYGLIQLKRNDRDGYYLSLTKRRTEMLQKALKKHKTIEINEYLTITIDNLEFKELVKGNTKIFLPKMGNTSNNVLALKEKLINLVKKTYVNNLTSFGNKYKTIFKSLARFIAIIDFVKSGAKTAKNYNYCKPVITLNKDKGFFDAKRLRHPIAERIRTKVAYIPHDIKLGLELEQDENMDGMLLYGLNSSGKSTVMKAIGLAVIMAQSGLYVPSDSFNYSPYTSIFARITGSDNIFKGLSQFSLEMTELSAILKRNGPKTLVIGDEVCRGTEHVSGNSIVATTIIMLARSKCSFIFASHLHEIAKMKRIKELDNVKIFHLTVDYDKKNDQLIFDRLLKPGSGSNIYGLTVAKYIIKDTEFIKLAQEIKNEFLGLPNEILPVKTATYNSKLYIKCCQTCGKTNNTKEEYTGLLDVHHINFQSKCNENGFIIGKSHLKKNDLHNLVVLCKKCHHMVHHNQLTINGYKDTTNGRILDYQFTTKSIKTKRKSNKKIVVKSKIKKKRNKQTLPVSI